MPMTSQPLPSNARLTFAPMKPAAPVTSIGFGVFINSDMQSTRPYLRWGSVTEPRCFVTGLAEQKVIFCAARDD